MTSLPKRKKIKYEESSFGYDVETGEQLKHQFVRTLSEKEELIRENFLEMMRFRGYTKKKEGKGQSQQELNGIYELGKEIDTQLPDKLLVFFVSGGESGTDTLTTLGKQIKKYEIKDVIFVTGKKLTTKGQEGLARYRQDYNITHFIEKEFYAKVRLNADVSEYILMSPKTKGEHIGSGEKDPRRYPTVIITDPQIKYCGTGSGNIVLVRDKDGEIRYRRVR